MNGAEWRFIIRLACPSVNALHDIWWHRREVVLKPAVRKWKNDVMLLLPRMEVGNALVEINLIFHYPFHYRNGNLRRFDTHNMVKALIDAIAEKVGFDDSKVKTGSWASVDSEVEQVEVCVRAVPLHGHTGDTDR